MTPIVAALAVKPVRAWRIDQSIFAATWDSGEGSFLAGGRWNSKGVRAVYCSLDASTTILELAVHKGFKALDTVQHTLTTVSIPEPSNIHVVSASHIPNQNWLAPGIPSAGQQAFGDALLAKHRVVALPSVVSRYCWNLIFVATHAAGLYSFAQEPFALDPRLHPPV